MSRLYLLIGNGNSIGIISSINKYRNSIGLSPLPIDLTNLFFYGDQFMFPNTSTPFLSEENCPNLWALGARPQMDSVSAYDIISQIITCGNVYALACQEREDLFSLTHSAAVSFDPILCSDLISPLYYRAYAEFSSYLRYLMIYYNSLVTDEDLLHISVPLLDSIHYLYYCVDEIIINSYNYDVYLERLLMLRGLPFHLGGFGRNHTKIIFYKPHGSISFSYKKKFPYGCPYQIPYDELSYQQRIELSDFDITYQFENDYPMHNGLIPPAGEAERFAICYYNDISNAILKSVRLSRPGDPYFIIGSSYSTFDRFELDRINTTFHSAIRVTYVNPAPNSELVAVLKSLFPDYHQIPYYEL